MLFFPLVLVVSSLMTSFASLADVQTKLQNTQFVVKNQAKFLLQDGLVKTSQVVDKSVSKSVIFAVKQNNVDQLDSILMDVSSPKSANYGKHWSRDQISQLTANPTATQAVQEFLNDLGIAVVDVTLYGEYIEAVASVEVWEAVFNTNFGVYHDSVAQKNVVRALSYSLPSHLMDHVHAAFGVVDYLPSIKAPNQKSEILKKGVKKEASSNSLRQLSSDLECTVYDYSGYYFTYCVTTPALLFDYYNIDSPYGSSLASQTIYGSLNQSFSPTDLTEFQEGFNLLVHPVEGAYDGHMYDDACFYNADDCIEASLDVQYITTIAQSVPTYYDYTDNEWVDWIVSVANMTNPPDLFSMSYGGYEFFLTESDMDTWNIEAAKLGIMGVSIIVSSGDDGVSGYAVRDNAQWCAYYPQFPASSPYVTVIGATQGQEFGNKEVTCQVPTSSITSGGGFSDLALTPLYQYNYISTYFKNAAQAGHTPVSGFNVTGRAYPDVSMLGSNYVIFANATTEVVSGTSASAPVFAGVVSLANSIRKEANMSAMGFLNPFLYEYGSSFVNDITSGDNKCTASTGEELSGGYIVYTGTCCTQGFYATSGWDPVTGLGSVDVKKFLNTVKQVSGLSSDDSSNDSLSAGAIAGIVIGVLAGVGIIVGVLCWYFLVYLKATSAPMASKQELSTSNNKL